MKRLTDAMVTKALKKKKQPSSVKGCGLVWKVGETEYSGAEKFYPNYTTSLDAIVAEIEALKLWHKSGRGIVIGGGPRNKQAYYAQIHGADPVYAETQPLALCAALLAYLKEQR